MWAFLRHLFLRRPSTPTGGEEGERAAESHLAAHGHRILARNWRNPADTREEIDLVTQDGPVLVFVEVKARSFAAAVPGYFAVDRRKKKVLLRVCLAYLKTLRPRPATFRLDVVEVETGRPCGAVVRHFENVPLFRKHDRR